MIHRSLVAAALVALVALGCAPSELGLPPVAPGTVEPEIRVGLVRGVESAVLGGGPGGGTVLDPAGQTRIRLAPGAVARVVAAGGQVQLTAEGTTVTGARFDLVPDALGLVRVADRDYRGQLELSVLDGRVVVVNRLGIESYLAGVVNAEMGRRAEAEAEALAAQAIVSRTYALRSLARGAAQRWDVVATVSDQAYLGVGSELEQGWNAIRRTHGIVLEYDGDLIDPFFHSTCAGRTAEGREIFQYAERPYLRSVSDAAPGGTDWCAISPRYRWTEQWTGAALEAVLRQTLPPLGLDPAGRGALRDVKVQSRSASGRVTELAVEYARGTVTVRGHGVRQALRPSGIDQLRSTSFRLVATRSGDRLDRLTADGGGAGHGVGMCQWGAVGRARAGHTAGDILQAYFPGTALGRRW